MSITLRGGGRVATSGRTTTSSYEVKNATIKKKMRLIKIPKAEEKEITISLKISARDFQKLRYTGQLAVPRVLITGEISSDQVCGHIACKNPFQCFENRKKEPIEHTKKRGRPLKIKRLVVKRAEPVGNEEERE